MAVTLALRRFLLGFDQHPIPADKLANLRRYKYNSVDHSVASRLLTPYWNALVRLFPLWVAYPPLCLGADWMACRPNVITFTGLVIMASACLLVVWYSPTLSAELPPWVYAYTAFGLFAYQSLDAIDGKQARRTGMAGPLGELFDHGCDAINLALLGFVMPAIVRLGPNLSCMSMMAFGMLAFYLSSWEEYNTGGLYFGLISGPTEGTFVLVGLCIFSAIVGGSFWLQKVALPFGIGEVGLNMVFFQVAALLCLVTVLLSLKNGLVASGIASVMQTLSFWVLMSACVGLYAVIPELALFPNFVMYFLICGLAFASSVARVITAHITKGAYPHWTPTYLPIAAAVLRAVNDKYKVVPYMFQGPLTRFLAISLAYNALVYGRLVVCTILQICEYLDISCFTVRKTRQKHQ